MNIQFSSPAATVPKVLWSTGETTRVTENQHQHEVTLKIGIGKLEEVDGRKLIAIARKVVRTAREYSYSSIAIACKDFSFSKTNSMSDRELGRILGENFEMANYEFTRYKTSKEKTSVETIFVEGASLDAQAGFAEGQVIGREINYARDLANTPGSDMTPEILADAAKRQFKGTSVKVTVLNLSQIKKLKMGLILGVAKGSAEEPKFIIAEYWGLPREKQPIILIGKGITFDTGGINLKPTDALMGMNQDMTGGATVLASVAIAAKLKLKKNVIALVPAVENAVSGSAYRPGDVLTAMNGKTVEVLNTDAEGRLILADALTYAERYSPRLVVDVATLTGAALVVLGKRASVIMTRDQKLEDTLRDIGEKSGDYVWPLPLWKEYEADLKSNVADIANVSGGASAKAGGGAILGGIFLLPFAEKFPLFAHIDIAPRMESIPEDNLARGATGTPIRLLTRLIQEI